MTLALAVRRTLSTAAFVLLVAAVLPACKPAEERVEDHLARAAELEKSGSPAEALIELRAALQLEPQRSETNLRIANLYMSLQNPDDALFYYREAYRLDPRSIDAGLGIARLLQVSDPKEAKRLLQELADEDPTRSSVHGELSNAALRDNDLDLALREALLAAELSPESVAAQTQVGLVYTARIRSLRQARKAVPDKLFQEADAAFGRAHSAASEETPPGLRIRAWVQQASLYARWPERRPKLRELLQQGFDDLADTPAAVRAELASRSEQLARRMHDAELLRWCLGRRTELAPGDMRAWQELALLVRASGGDALEVLSHLTAVRPRDAEARSLYAQHLTLAGRYDEAVRYLEGKLDSVDHPDRLLAALVVLHLNQGHGDAAGQVAARLEKEYPTSSETYFAKAKVAMYEGHSSEAISWATRWAQKDEAPGAYRLLSEWELRRGNPRAAVTAADHALELARSRGLKLRPFHCTRGVALARSRDYEAAVTALVTARRSAGPAGEGCDLVLAESLYGTGRADQARKLLDRLLDEDPSPAAVLLFVQNEKRRDTARSLELLEQALQDHPGNARLLAARVRMYLDTGQKEEALARVRRAMKAEPERPQLLLILGQTLAATGDNEQALQVLEKGIDRWSSMPGATQMYATLLARVGRLDQARDTFEALYREGRLPLASQPLLARLRIQTGDEDQGVELLESVLAENPGATEAANDLAYQLAKRGEQLDRATELAQDARAREPESAQIADTLGWVYLKRGLNGAALVQFDAAVELADEQSPAWATATYHRGVALRSLERPQEALEAVEEALASGTDFREAEDARALAKELAAAAHAS